MGSRIVDSFGVLDGVVVGSWPYSCTGVPHHFAFPADPEIAEALLSACTQSSPGERSSLVSFLDRRRPRFDARLDEVRSIVAGDERDRIVDALARLSGSGRDEVMTALGVDGETVRTARWRHGTLRLERHDRLLELSAPEVIVAGERAAIGALISDPSIALRTPTGAELVESFRQEFFEAYGDEPEEPPDAPSALFFLCIQTATLPDSENLGIGSEVGNDDVLRERLQLSRLVLDGSTANLSDGLYEWIDRVSLGVGDELLADADRLAGMRGGAALATCLRKFAGEGGAVVSFVANRDDGDD